MSRYGRILSPDFLEAARKFSSKLSSLPSSGIAANVASLQRTFEEHHKQDVDQLFPPSCAQFPISSNEYMIGCMQATNSEMKNFLCHMAERNMCVVDRVNRKKGHFIRIPPDPIFRNYGVIRSDASVATKVNFVTSPNEAYIGRGGAYYNERGQIFFTFAENEKLTWGRNTNRRIEWADFVCLQEAEALLHVIRERRSPEMIKAYEDSCGLSWRESPMSPIALICDNLRLANVGNGVEAIPPFLYESFADIYLELKDTEGYVFSHEHREQNKISDFLANTSMKVLRGDQLVWEHEDNYLEYLLSKEKFVAKQNIGESSFRFKAF